MCSHISCVHPDTSSLSPHSTWDLLLVGHRGLGCEAQQWEGSWKWGIIKGPRAMIGHVAQISGTCLHKTYPSYALFPVFSHIYPPQSILLSPTHSVSPAFGASPSIPYIVSHISTLLLKHAIINFMVSPNALPWHPISSILL